MSLKLDNVLALIKKNEANGMMFWSPYNRFWFTGFESSAGYVFVNNKGRAIYVVDNRYYEAAKAESENCEVRLLGELSYRGDVSKQLKDIVDELKITNLLVENEYVTIGMIDSIKNFVANFKGVNSVNLRSVKDSSEIEKLQKAADIAAETENWIKEIIKPGMTELQVANMITNHMVELGATKNSFDPIVASGINGSVPHHSPTDKKIEEGEMVTIDIGCMYQGYASDITRTITIGKLANPEMQVIYDIVKKAQEAGIVAAREGTSGMSIDAVCRDYINSTKYGKYFIHSTGHGVGVEVHEQPNVSPTSRNTIMANSVITVEPGIYVPGLGGVRIEDTLVVHKKGGPTILTGLATK